MHRIQQFVAMLCFCRNKIKGSFAIAVLHAWEKMRRNLPAVSQLIHCVLFFALLVNKVYLHT